MIETDVTPRFELSLKCGGCTKCCQGELVFLHPECGDDSAQYETQSVDGRTALAQKENGDCHYLSRTHGCTIHRTRPIVCRELDCRLFLRPDLRRLPEAKALRKAALRLNKRMNGKPALAKQIWPPTANPDSNAP